VGQILSDFTPASFTSVITEADNNQLSQLENQQTADSNQISAWSTLQSDARTVSGDLSTLGLASTFQQLSATSSSSSVATAVDNSAQAGFYQITVGSLAAIVGWTCPLDSNGIPFEASRKCGGDVG